MMRSRKFFLFAFVPLLAFFFFGSVGPPVIAEEARSALDVYLYQDTRQLVRLVEEAAMLLEARGPAAFDEFGKKGSKWLDDKHYFFVYSKEGVCLFHPIEPELVGKNLINIRDMNGKPVVKMVADIGRKPGDRAAGWVFYLWEEGTQISPLWKSSYIRKVIGPDKKIYLIGCGLYNLKIEKEFIRERVDLAAELLRTERSELAFREFRNPASVFYFLDTYIFVLGTDGRSLVDPAYPTAGRDLSGFRDALGRYVVMEMIDKLRDADSAWVQYMWPKPGASLPSRKLAYVRKVRVENRDLIVGADFFLATPIWMKM